MKGLSFGRLWVAAFPFATWMTLGEPVRAQEAAPVVAVATVDHARLEYTAAPGCYDEETFHHAVASFMDEAADPFDERAAAALKVTFKKVRGGYRGVLQKMPAKGEPWPEEERTGARCEDVFHDIALLASLRMLGPPKPIHPPEAPPPEDSPPDVSALPELPAPETSPEPERPAAAPPPSRPSPSPQAVADPFRSWRAFRSYMNLSIGLSGLLLMSMGYTDNVAPGFGLGLEFRGMPPAWGGFGLSIGFEFRGLPPARATARERWDPTISSTYPQPLDVSTWTGLVVPCLRFAKYFSGCAVGQLGAIFMKGPVEQTGGLTATLGARLGVEIPFAERFAVFALGEALFNPVPGTRGSGNGVIFNLPPENDPQGRVPNVFWHEPVVSGFIGAGISVRFE